MTRGTLHCDRFPHRLIVRSIHTDLQTFGSLTCHKFVIHGSSAALAGGGGGGVGGWLGLHFACTLRELI